MPTLNIAGRKVNVGDEFLKLSPEQQDAAVDEIARSLGGSNGQVVHSTEPSAPGQLDAQQQDALARARARRDQGLPAPQPQGHNAPEFDPRISGYNPKTGRLEQDALGTYALGLPEGVPLIGGALDKAVLNTSAALGSAISGRDFSGVKREMQGMRDYGRESHPIARTAGNITGAVASMAPIGATATGARVLGLRGPSLGARTLASSGSSAALSGADTLARGGSFEDAGRAALIGGGIGAVLPAAGRAFSQVGSKAATAAAPSVESLRQASSQLYKRATEAGVMVKSQAFDKHMYKLAAQLRNFGFDADLHPDTMAALKRLSQARGQNLSLQDLEILRRVAGNAAKAQKDDDRAAASMVIDAIDDIVDDARNFSFGNGRSLSAPGAPQASTSDALRSLTDARAGWHTMKKAETIDELFRRAGIKAETTSGPRFVQTLRNEFKNLTLRKNGLRGFTDAEQAAINGFIRGGKAEKLMSGVGKWLGGLTSTGVGGVVGFAHGGPIGASAMMLGAQGAGALMRRAGARMGNAAAQRAGATIRSGGQRVMRNFAPDQASRLETALRGAPLLTYDWGRQ
jgi:hypothetical protein